MFPLQGVEFDAEAAALEDQYGAPRGEPGQWAACLRIVDPNSLSTVFVQELDNNEAITSMNIVHFAPAAVQVGVGLGGDVQGKEMCGENSASSSFRHLPRMRCASLPFLDVHALTFDPSSYTQAAGGFPGEPLLIVGTARGLKYLPTECDGELTRG